MRLSSLFVLLLVVCLHTACSEPKNNDMPNIQLPPEIESAVNAAEQHLYKNAHRDELNTNKVDDLKQLIQFSLSDAARDLSNKRDASKNFSQAKEYCQKLLVLSPESSEVYRDLALIYFNGDKDYAKSIENAKTAIAKGWQNFDMPYVLGRSYTAMGNKDEAKKYLTSALAMMNKIAASNPQIKDFPEYKEIKALLNK
jgi:tetratricopeptide (TPR) repeat protein